MTEFILGVIASLLAATLFPVIAEMGSALLVRMIGWLPLKGKTNLSGTWSSTWHVDSPRFPPSVTDDNSEIHQLWNRVYMQHNADGIKFHANGKIDSGRYVTGVWFDETDGGYHGAFQLIIDPKTRNMSGEWVGYSTTGIVKHGKWVWVQKRPNPSVNTDAAR
jgi:hypothetical protein